MAAAASNDESRRTGAAVFGTTHWSVVLTAGKGESPRAAEAMEALCRSYWYPLYVFVRRRGYNPQDAQDLTQAFFAHLLAKDFLAGVGPEKGRFRSFLLVCLKHFLSDERAKARAAKRGGTVAPVMLDLGEAEERYQLEAQVDASPETLYERRWAVDLLDRVLDRQRQEAVVADRDTRFNELKGCLLGEDPMETYAQLGTRLGLSETAVKVAVYRLRQRYRELLRDEIAHTVTRPEEVEEELRYLFAIVSR